MKKIFICLLVFSVTGTAIAQTKTTKSTTAPAQVVEQDEFTPLSLTAEQRAEIKKIDAEIEKRMNASDRTPQMQAQMEQKMQNYRLEKIRSILKPEQIEIFDTYVKTGEFNTAAKPAKGKVADLNVAEIEKMIELKEGQIDQLKTVYAELDQQAKSAGNNETKLQEVRKKKASALSSILSDEQLTRLNEMLK